MGFEPTTPGTTIQCSNQLSYSHRLYWAAKIVLYRLINKVYQKKTFTSFHRLLPEA